MELVRINTTLSKQVLEKVDHYAEELQEDRSTAIRQLLSRAVLEIEKQKIIQAYKEKKLTIRQAADALGMDYWQVQEFLELYGLPVSDITKAEIREKKIKIKKLQSFE